MSFLQIEATRFVISQVMLFIIALASVVSTAQVFYSVSLICIGIIQEKQRQAK